MEEEVGVFPEVKQLNNQYKTDFSPTLETRFDPKKNIVYAATLPMAWNEVRRALVGPFTNISTPQLKDLNSTTSFENVLKKSEYNTEVEIKGDRITAKAFFRKSLPFKEPLVKYDAPFQFGKNEVESFGFYGECEFAKINYYNGNNDFSISLLPKNKEHEIVLVLFQADINYTSFQEYYKRYQDLKNKPHEEKDDWRYYLGHRDKVQVPIIEFNLEKNFTQVEGSTFTVGEQQFRVAEAYQRNAFILNENGAKVESYAETTADAVEAMEKPKLMIFNKPFVVFLKRKDSDNPYFATYIQNEELLKKID